MIEPDDRNAPSSTEDAPPWLDSIRRELDASTRDLDAHTLSRLNRARQRALLEARLRTRLRPVWMLAGVASVVLAMFLLPTLQPVEVPSLPAQTADVDDFELLTSEDQLALYSDLDFYAWLDTQDLDG